MRLTRRGWIGASAALTGISFSAGSSAAPPLSATGLPAGDFRILSPGAGHDYGPALAALRDYALAELIAWGLPGMTLSVTDLDGFAAVLALGWADVDRRIPVDPGHYFQIGSISKSFIALTLLALADEGRVDIDAPVARYLPDAALPPEPIPRSGVASGLLAHVIVSKMCDHLPLQRQEAMLARHGWDVRRSTLCDHLRRCGELLTPLYDAMRRRLLQSSIHRFDGEPDRLAMV